MARHIAVYRKEDLTFVKDAPSDVNSPDFDNWVARVEALCQYDNQLGSESAVRMFWSEPAQSLGLHLVASIYEVGFYEGIEWSGPDFDRLAEELGVLEHHWQTMSLEGSDLNDLKERMSFLRAAITLAKQCDGVITIG